MDRLEKILFIISIVALLISSVSIIYSYVVITPLIAKTSEEVSYTRDMVETFGKAAGIAGLEYAKRILDARVEGKVVVYAGLDVEACMKTFEVFTKKYGIEVEYWRADYTGILERVSSEKAAGKVLADLIVLAPEYMNEAKADGLIRKYVSPESKAYLESSKDPEGYWAGGPQAVYFSIIYNTELVAPEDVPKSYQDLLDPKWAGKKICLGDCRLVGSALTWFGISMKEGILTEDYFKALARQDPLLMKGRTAMIQLCGTGEFPILAWGEAYTAESLKNEGYPLGWVKIPTLYKAIDTIAVTANSMHPNAAELLVDFWLSLEGQITFRDCGESPQRDIPQLWWPIDYKPTKTYGGALTKEEGEHYLELFTKWFVEKKFD